MKAIFVNQGNYVLKDVHEPWATSYGVKVELAYSAVSFGTEGNTRGGQRFSKILFNRSRWRKAAQILKESRKPSVVWRKYRNLKDVYESVGYSAVGRVLEVGRSVSIDVKPGDLVHVGGEFACHQQIVCVPQNFVFKLRTEIGQNLNPWLYVATILSVPFHAVRHAQEIFIKPDIRRPKALIVGGGIIGTFAGLFLDNEFDVELYDISAKVLADNFFQRTTKSSQYDFVVYSTPSMDGSSKIFERCNEGAVLSIVGETAVNIDRPILEDKLMTVRFCKSFGYGRGNKAYEEGLRDLEDSRFQWTMRRNIGESIAYVETNIGEKPRFRDLINLVNPAEISLDRSRINIFDWSRLSVHSK